MDKRLDFTGGNPDIRLDQILIDAEANRPALFAMLASYAVGTNKNFIIDGCAPTTTSTTWSITAGYIFLNDEILEVEAQSGTWDDSTDELAYDKVTTYDPKGDITYNDGTPRQTWQKNRGVVSVQTSSVLSTQLNVVSGDSLIDKIKTAVGAASTTNFGVIATASATDIKAGLTNNAVTSSGFQSVKATDADAIAGTETKEWVSPAGMAARDASLVTKVVEIGDWDMDADDTHSVAHGLTSSKIRDVRVLIRRDDDLTSYDLNMQSNTLAAAVIGGSIASITTTNIIMTRPSLSFFNDTNFVTPPSGNRGWIVIKYVQ